MEIEVTLYIDTAQLYSEIQNTNHSWEQNEDRISEYIKPVMVRKK